MTPLLSQPRIGSQRPRLSSVPLYVSTLGQDAVALSKHAGLVLDPWQEYVIEESLGIRAGGRWAAMEVGLIVPRQNGKGSVIEARQLAAMFLTRDAEIIYSAHQMKTSRKMYRRIKKLCQKTPDLNKLVAGRYRESNELMGIELDWGILQFVARSGGSGRGFTGNTLFFDEAYDLDPEMLADTIPALAAVRNAQVWYVSSAGKTTSEALANIRARGIAGDKLLAFFEWSAEQGVDLDLDDDALYACNPSMGLHLDYEYVRTVERGSMPDDELFGRERFGIWKPPAKARPAVFDAAGWGSMAEHETPLRDSTVCLAVSATDDCEWWSISAVRELVDGRVHLEVGMHSQVSRAEARAFLRKKVHDWKPCAVVIHRNDPAMILVPELMVDKIEPETTTAAQYVQACNGFLNDATSNGLSHVEDTNLDGSVLNAAKHVTPSGWTWEQVDPDGAPLSPLRSATLARWGLKTFGALAKPPQQMPTQAPTQANERTETYDLMSVGF